MKKCTALLVLLALLLGGCGREAPAPTTAPTAPATTAPTTEPTTVPTTEPLPVYINPLTGEQLDKPFTGRLYAFSINNLRDAMPHVGLRQADLVFEMYVNGSVIRDLAVFTDPDTVPAIGPIRSTRYIFTQLAVCYDLVMNHAGGWGMVLQDANAQGIDHYSIDVPDDTSFAFRDQKRFHSGYTWDACLFAKGPGIQAHAEEKGVDTVGGPDQDYGLLFADDGTPQDGETAEAIHITLTHKSRRATSKKETHMIYHPELDRYVYNQYGKELYDGATGLPESFQNVLIVMGEIQMNQYGYQIMDFQQGGTGYYACGGKIIPITWKSEGGTSPLQFFRTDGTPLQMGRGNSYIALTQTESEISYEKLEAPEETGEPAPVTEDDGIPAAADEDYL